MRARPRRPRVGNKRVQALVVEQSLNEQCARLLDVDHQRKERFFFPAEVRHARRAKEADERRSGAAGIIVSVCRPAEPLCFDEGMVVVVRDRDQRLEPLHPWNLAARFREGLRAAQGPNIGG